AVEVSPLNDGMEIQLRRLVGVHLADECEDWEVCESIQFTPSSKSLLPRNEVDRAFKTAVQRKRLMTSVGNRSVARSSSPIACLEWRCFHCLRCERSFIHRSDPFDRAGSNIAVGPAFNEGV